MRACRDAASWAELAVCLRGRPVPCECSHARSVIVLTGYYPTFGAGCSHANSITSSGLMPSTCSCLRHLFRPAGYAGFRVILLVLGVGGGGKGYDVRFVQSVARGRLHGDGHVVFMMVAVLLPCPLNLGSLDFSLLLLMVAHCFSFFSVCGLMTHCGRHCDGLVMMIFGYSSLSHPSPS